MLVKRTELLEALNLVGMAVNSKETAAQASFFMFTGDHIVGDNEILHISYPFKTGVIGAVKAEELTSVLSKMIEPSLNMEVEDDKLIFKIGKSKTGLALQPLLRENAAYLKPSSSDEGTLLFETDTEIMLALEAAAPCCSANLSNRAMSAIEISDSGMIACDNFQAILIDTAIDSLKGQKSILLPASVVKPLSALGFTNIKMLDNFRAEAMNPQTGVWMLFDLIDTDEIEYPDITEIFDDGGSDITFPEGFLDAVKKAEIFAKNSLKSEEVYVTISITDGVMKVYGEGTNGFYEEEFDAPKMADGQFVVSPRTLEFLLSKEGYKARVILDSELPRIRFENENFVYAITIES